jgi:vitamin B12 transporter
VQAAIPKFLLQRFRRSAREEQGSLSSLFFLYQLMTRAFRCSLACFLAVLIGTTASADDDFSSSGEVVVTATRSPQDRKTLSQSVDVITGASLEARGIATVSRALQEIPGVSVVTTGGTGGISSVFIRGGNSEHTLVLVDGVEINNPASNNRSFNFGSLLVSGIERIEVVRGPQGVMYGSDGLGGVIHIITKKSLHSQRSVKVEGGTYGTRRVVAQSQSRSKVGGLSLSFEDNDTRGISSASSRLGNQERDEASQRQFSLHGDVKPSDNLTIEGSILHTRLRNDIDNFGGVGGDDSNRRNKSDNFALTTSAEYKFIPQVWTSKIIGAYRRDTLRDQNDADILHPDDSLRSEYQGDFQKYSLLHFLTPSDTLYLTVGGEVERERASGSYDSTSSFGPFSDPFSGTSVTTSGAFASAGIEATKSLSLMGGGRIDHSSLFDSYRTWSVGPQYTFHDTHTRFFGTFSTGFKAPSLYQRYSQYGSSTLNPEEVRGWDMGVEQRIGEKGSLVRATYFRQSFTNLISFDPSTFLFNNIARASTSGVETFLSLSLLEHVTSNLSYTYTDTEDLKTGTSLLRRARNQASLRFTYGETLPFEASLGVLINGRRFDTSFAGTSPERVTLGGYTTTDISLKYRTSPAWEYSLRVLNAFNARYEQVVGYGVLGAQVYGGVQWTF